MGEPETRPPRAPQSDAATPPPSSGYRPHLDGIRALAVTAVILFHLGYGWIPGGFVGVDVFFVLSGYLITGILLDEAHRRDTIRLGRFYARRVRRLLPASGAVLLVVLFATWHLLDPVQRHGIRWDAGIAAVYSANWRFALVGGDYFAPGDVPSPLVHYWSLAVEEQFYLVWPALLLVVYRVARRVRSHQPLDVVLVAVGALLAASAAVSVLAAGSPLTYYGTHARAYQLLAGGLLAAAVRRTGWRFPATTGGRRRAGALAVGGLVALAVLAVRVSDASTYPGWPGVWVTLASLALVAGLDLAPPGALTAVIGHRSMAAVGRLSYSLYIWHWPAIVLLPLLGARWGGGWTRLGDRDVLTAVIVVVALASYLVIERPIRFRLRPQARPIPVVAVGLVASLLIGALALWSFRPRDDFEQRVLATVADHAKAGRCPYAEKDWPSADRSEPCLYRDGAGLTVALVGDSHAQQWVPAMDVLADRTDIRVVRATRGGCPANDVTAFALGPAGRIDVDTECTRWRRSVFRKLVDDYDPDVIIVATRSHVSGVQSDGEDVPRRDPRHPAAWAAGWKWTIDTLASGGATVIVSEILPSLPEPVPACLIEHGEGTSACDFPVAADRFVVPYNAFIKTLDGTHRGRVHVIDPTPIACPNGRCRAVIGGQIVHRDDNHLSASFVRTHADQWEALLRTTGVDFGAG